MIVTRLVSFATLSSPKLSFCAIAGPFEQQVEAEDDAHKEHPHNSRATVFGEQQPFVVAYLSEDIDHSHQV